MVALSGVFSGALFGGGLASIVGLGLMMAGASYSENHALCTSCHIVAEPVQQGAVLLEPLPGLCITCHAGRIMKGEHPIDIAPGPSGSAGLPLMDGKISCTTCHDSHTKAATLLRAPADKLCIMCHPK